MPVISALGTSRTTSCVSSAARAGSRSPSTTRSRTGTRRRCRRCPSATNARFGPDSGATLNSALDWNNPLFSAPTPNTSKDDDGDQRQPELRSQRELHAQDVDRQKDSVAADPPDRERDARQERLQVSGHCHHRHAHGEHVLDRVCHAADKAAEVAERRARERVEAAGMGQRRGELGDAKHHAHVHGGHQSGCDGQAPKSLPRRARNSNQSTRLK